MKWGSIFAFVFYYRYVTSGYSPISVRLVEMILKDGKLGAGGLLLVRSYE